MRKPLAAFIAMTTLVSACAPSQPMLDSAQADCAAGNHYACQSVPAIQSRVIAERNANVVVGAGAVLAVAALGLGIAALAHHPGYRGYYASPPRGFYP